MSDGGDRPAAPDEPAPIAPRTRSRRRNGPRSIERKDMTRAAMAVDALTDADREALEARPKTRGECVEGERPCPWVSCKHHLYLDINPETGSIKINFPDRAPGDLEHTCALDIVETGDKTLYEIGDIMNLTHEAVRLIEIRGLMKLKTTGEL